MSIKSFAIRSARKLIDHLDTEPRLLIIESDDGRCPMHTINSMLKKKYTYRYTPWAYGCHIIEATTSPWSTETSS